MNVIKILNLSKRCKIIRVIDTRLSINMSEDEIRKSIRMLLKDVFSCENINNLKLFSWKKIHDL